MAQKRHNIGLLVANIGDDFSKRLTIGAMEAARELDANLVIFPGKYLGVQHVNEDYEAEYEYQYNVLFNLAAQAELDYLIVAVGTIAYAHNHAYQKAFLDSLGSTPILSVASVLEGYDCLQFDNTSGILEAVDYLASHGRKHIGMIAADINNDEFLQRYHAYRQALEANHLTFKDSYMSPSRMAYRCYDVVKKMLDDNPEMDAIVCATDIIAYDVYEVLGRRNLRVGVDVAVVGYDDLPADANMEPPLASIRADAVVLGRRAVEKAVHHLDGVQDDCQLLEPQFMPRRSCFKYIDAFIVDDMLLSSDYNTMVAYVQQYLQERRANQTADDALCAQVLEIFEHINRYYLQQPADESMVETTVGLLRKAFPLKEDLGIDKILYANYVWMIRHCPVSNIPYVEMFHRFFRDEKKADSTEAVVKQYVARSHINNEFIRDALMFSGSIRDNYARIMKKLDSVGAVTSFIYTFQKPIIHRYGDRFPEQLAWSFKSYSYGHDGFSVPRDQQRMSTPQVFDNDYLCTDRQHIFIVADLFSAETQYGIALLEPRDEAFLDELELVTYQLSSAVRTLDILKEQAKLLEELHTTNLALDKMSKIDELTHVYNRKGFYPAADALINDPQYQGKPFVVCFADMDDLKGINDTYGHAEGDFSLRLVARCLAHALGEKAIISRMGGDEFAAIVPLTPELSLDEMMMEKEQFINRFNSSGEKPYRFDVSVGMLACLCENSYDLGAALDRADDLLYNEKREKKLRRRK